MSEAFTSTPSFTILITTYNRVDLLDRAINSALSQTLPCQVVVVDDGSTDETESYLQQWVKTSQEKGDFRLVYHRNSENKGHAKSVNIGVEMGRGEWIKFLDDDDYLAEDCLEVMAKAIARSPNSVICSVRCTNVDLDGNERGHSQMRGSEPVFYIPQEDIHYGMLIEQVPFGTPVQVAVKREELLLSGGWKSGLDINFDDIESWINVAKFGDAVFIQKCLAYRTIWKGSYHANISLQQRLESHILIKTKIYESVSDRHRKKLPGLVNINAYLQLYWGLVALQRKRPLESINLLFPAFLSPTAWRLLREVLAFRRNPNTSTEIRKIPLTDG